MQRRYYFISDALNGEFSIRLANDVRAKHLAVCFYSMEAANYVVVYTINDFGERVFHPDLSFGNVHESGEV